MVHRLHTNSHGETMYHSGKLVQQKIPLPYCGAMVKQIWLYIADNKHNLTW